MLNNPIYYILIITTVFISSACANYSGKSMDSANSSGFLSSNSYSNQVVGRWKWTKDGKDNSSISEYMKDGTVAWTNGYSGSLAGTWSISGDKFSVNQSGFQRIFTIKQISETSITLVEIPNGSIHNGVRVN